MKTLIFAPCTGVKAFYLNQPYWANAKDIKRGRVIDVAAAWNEKIENQQKMMIARDMYMGPAWKLARSASDSVSGELYAISPGLGLVRESQMIPVYDMTISFNKKLKNSIKKRITTRKFMKSDWWNALGMHPNRQTDLLEVINAVDADLILIALFVDFAEMLQDALSILPENIVSRVRIFGRNIEEKVPVNVQKCVMPYDDRLKSVIDGRIRDFASRALKHYCDTLSSNKSNLGHSIAIDKEILTEMMNNWIPYTIR